MVFKNIKDKAWVQISFTENFDNRLLFVFLIVLVTCLEMQWIECYIFQITYSCANILIIIEKQITNIGVFSIDN